MRHCGGVMPYCREYCVISILFVCVFIIFLYLHRHKSLLFKQKSANESHMCGVAYICKCVYYICMYDVAAVEQLVLVGITTAMSGSGNSFAADWIWWPETLWDV